MKCLSMPCGVKCELRTICKQMRAFPHIDLGQLAIAVKLIVRLVGQNCVSLSMSLQISCEK